MKRHGIQSISRPTAWLMASLLAGLVAGCGGDGGGTAAGVGTLGIALTDSPSCGFDKVNVTVRQVRVHKSGTASDTDAGWSDITLNPARKIDLLSLTNGVLDVLGETPLPSGHYTQLRLVLDPNTSNTLVNSVVPTGGTETALKTPSAVQSGIKLINSFDVPAGQRVDLMVDFDACKSIVTHSNGTYALKPVIRVIPFVLNGIEGFVALPVPGGSMVTAQQNGAIVQSSAPNATSGKFFLARVAPGDYDVVLTADARATAVIAAVPVATVTSITVLSTDVAPITLPASSTHNLSGTETLNPTSSTVVAFATAKQAVGTVPVVTVKFVAADDTAVVAGSYSLTLPSGAPLLGHYGTGTLPIALAAQSGAGLYTEEASATGYTTQSFPEDISATDATQNSVLVP